MDRVDQLEREVEQLRNELSAANASIGKLTSMLEKSFQIIELLGGDGVVSEQMDCSGSSCDAVLPAYLNVDDVAAMLNCSRQTAAKRMRELGAASIGHKLYVKRDGFLAVSS